jgi:hypothetical protein
METPGTRLLWSTSLLPEITVDSKAALIDQGPVLGASMSVPAIYRQPHYTTLITPWVIS